jgi:hypothetical protein
MGNRAMMNYLVDLNSLPQEKPREIDIGKGMSIDLLRAVYRNPSIPLPIRIRCAVAALPHEVPRLAVTALVNEQSFAELLEKRIKRMEAMNGQLPSQGPQIETPKPLPRIADQRFRRI